MRRTHANYAAIADALEPHQLRTLQECAVADGHSAAEWSAVPALRVVAVTLAVDRTVNHFVAAGISERQALFKAATLFDIDVETLLRRRRLLRSKSR